MRFRSLSLVLALLFSAPSLASSQMLPFGIAVEGRYGFATPVAEFSESDESFTAESGTSYAIGAQVRPSSILGIFAAFQRTDFECEQCVNLDLDDSVRLEGLEAGIDLRFPVGELPVAPWLRAGVVYQQFVFSGFDGESASDPEFGFSGGAGLSIPVLGYFEILPGVRYFTVPIEYSFDTPLRGGTFDVSAFTLDLGAAVRF